MRRTLSSASVRFLLTMVVMCAALLALPAMAYAASISGRVVDADTAVHLPAITVELYEWSGGTTSWDLVASVNTDVDGVYHFGGLAEATYRVGFTDYNYTLYVPEFWDGAATVDDALDVDLAGEPDRKDIDAALARQLGTARGSSISGHVTGSQTLWDCEGIQASVLRDDGAGGWELYASPTTGADGYYLATALPAGKYIVRFNDYSHGWYQTEYYRDAAVEGDATTIVIGEDSADAGIDAELELYPRTIAGIVKRADTSAPIDRVNAYVYYEYAPGEYQYITGYYTGADGRYVVMSLSSGTYKVEFADSDGRYLTEWYNDAADENSATPFVIGTETVFAGADAALDSAGAISGTVTAEDSGDPITTAYVYLYQYSEAYDSWDYYASASPNPGGAYEFVGLPHGTYRLYCYDYMYEYLPEYYQDAPGMLDATDVVTSATPNTGVDFVLALGGSVSGRVTDSITSAGITGASVTAMQYDLNSGVWYENGTYTAFTDASGNFTVTGLPPGTYRFIARHSTHVSEYWSEASAPEDGADRVFVDSTPQTGLDFTLTPCGTVSGHVSDVSGSTPLSNVSVYLYRLGADYSYGTPSWIMLGSPTAVTNASGDYTISNVPPGTYRARFYDQNMAPPYYLIEFFAEKPNVWAATDIVVEPGMTTFGVDAHMSAGATISGTVTDEADAPLSGVTVRALAYNPNDGDWEPYGSSAITDGSGNYTLSALPDDTYRLSFNRTGYVSQYYDAAASVFDGADVIISDGVSMTGKNAKLVAGGTPPYGTITGTVTSDASSGGVSAVQVIAWRSDPAEHSGWYWANSTNTNNVGGYSMSAPPGVYRIEFKDGYGRYLGEFYDDVTGGPATATHVSVTSDGTLVANASLRDAGSISGTVTSQSTSLPLSGIRTNCYARAGSDWYWVSSTDTGADGTYQVGGLTPGSYRIGFEDYSDTYRPEFYNGKASMTAADPILVGPSESRTGIDAALVRYGRVLGTVTGEDGRPVDAIYVVLYRRTPDSWSTANTYTTGEDGTYTFNALSPGEYIVRFSDTGAYGFDRYLAEYHTDATRQRDAAVLTITDADVTVNAALASTGTWGDITGTVTDKNTGDPIPGIAVCRHDPDGGGGWMFSGYADGTAADGTYRLPWVPAGTDYRVCADPLYPVDGSASWNGVYQMTYHLDAASIDDALSVTVTGGDVTPDVDIHATPEADIGYIRGHVIEDGSGNDIADVDVTLWRDDGGFSEFAHVITDASGRFARPVPAGTYALYFNGWPAHRPEMYADVDGSSPYDGTPVPVTAAASTEVTGSLEPLGFFSGTVTSESSGLPLSNVGVEVYFYRPGSGYDYIGSTSTDASGNYEARGLRYGGTYRAVFYDYTGDYVDEAYNGKPDYQRGDNVAVGPTPTTGIDASLIDAATISGVITDAATDLPVQNIYAQAYRFNEQTLSWDSFEGDYTDASGVYTITGMPAGTYRIGVFDYYDGYADEYYVDARALALATDIPVGSGVHVTGIDIALEKEGSISGTLTDVKTGDPIGSGYAYVYRYDPVAGEWQHVRNDQTDASGAYSLGQLAPDTYRLYFYRSGYIPEYYHNEYSAWAAAEVTVGSGENLTTMDEALSPGTTISGTVRNESGTGISQAIAVALRYDPHREVWTPATSAYTNSSGAYTLSGLGDYEYRVMFWDPYNRYLGEYYNDAATPGAGTPVSVSGGVAVAGIDAVLADYVAPPQGTIAGTVRSDADGTPVGGVTVSAAYYQPQYGSWAGAGSTTTAADGTYTLQVGVGTYRLFFDATDGDYLDEYYHDAFSSWWDGTDVVVNGGATTTVDEGLATAAHIRGTVTSEAGGTPLASIEAIVYKVRPGGGWDWFASAWTDASGTYDVGGLFAGTYVMLFMDSSNEYLTEYYDNVTDSNLATRLSIGAAEVRTGVNAALARAGTVSGTVTNEAGGRPVENLRVVLWRDDGGGMYEYETRSTGSDGEFFFGGLSSATYFLQFSDTDNPYGWPRFIEEWFAGAAGPDSATPIAVVNDAHTADAALTSTGTWGSIAGTVTDGASGHALANMPVDLYYFNGSAWVQDWAMAYTDASGNYVFPYVPELSGEAPYRVGTPIAGAPALATYYQETFHLDATDVDLAQDVPLLGDSYLTGVDIEMVRQPGIGWLGGTVQAEGTNAPLGGITVELHRAVGNDYVGSTTTLADGTYGFPVTADSYTLRFSDGTKAYAPEWFNNKTFWWDADPVAVAADGSATADASLAASAHITGAVRNSAGNPIETSVSVYDAASGNYIADAYAYGGTYAFDALRAGSYTVWFGSTGSYMGEYWNNRITAGDPITVSAGETRSSIDATLTLPGRIHGTVTADDDGVGPGQYVYLYAASPSGWDYVNGSYVQPGADWWYEFTNLLAGDYKVMFETQWGHTYPTLWYESALSMADATTVTVPEDGTAVADQMLDYLPPDVGSDVVSDYDTSASIEITATDMVVGVDSIFYAIDGGDVVTVTGSSATTEVVSWGDHTIEYWAQDLLGHQSDPVLVEFFVHDITGPSVTSDLLASYPTTATITITAFDNENGSGIDYISYVVDSDENTQTVYADTAVVEVGGIGDHHIEYWCYDREGNWSHHMGGDFTIADIEDPTADDDAVGTYSGTAVIHITAADNLGVDHISYRLDGGGWANVTSNPATITVATVGPHTLQYQAFDAAGNSSPVYSASFTITRAAGLVQTPIAGTNRYATSVAIAEAAFPTGADWVVIATGNNWPDALGGSALAGALDGPILLTDTNVLPSAIAAEITHLGAEKAIILGGTAAVGTPVENALKALLGAGDVERLAGTNRYGTADKVGARTISVLGGAYDGTAFVSTGANYPDALGAAPLAAGLHWPLFLTKPTGLDGTTVAAMTGVDHVLVLGGTAVVSPAIENSLKVRYGASSVDRLAGDNRYATAVAVAREGVAHGLHWNQVAIATGEQFPDALAGGVLQGRSGSVMLLTPTASLNGSVADALATNKSVIAEVRYLGGTGAVRQSVRDAVAAALN